MTMSGDLKQSEEDSDACLSDSIENFKNGDKSFVLCHRESWIIQEAKQILEALGKEQMILLTFLDEFQMNCHIIGERNSGVLYTNVAIYKKIFQLSFRKSEKHCFLGSNIL